MANAVPNSERRLQGLRLAPKPPAALPTDHDLADTPSPANRESWSTDVSASPEEPRQPEELQPQRLTLTPEATAQPDEFGSATDLEYLRLENEELRRIIADLHQRLEERAVQDEGAWVERQKEYDILLEEKSEVIRTLHQRIQEFQARPASPAIQAGTPREEELLALSEELERERLQLREDEEILELQMREMEIQMSRERAEIARQRHELQRLHADIQRELEMASRDTQLRERLMPLQRKHQELSNRRGGTPGQTPAAAATPPPTEPAKEKRRDSSFLKKLFRSGE